MLDEIDKLGTDFRGDPSSALLEVLDPEQNTIICRSLPECGRLICQMLIFITTGNLLDPMPPALRDRMEVLELPGYTQIEKKKIAQKYLIPKQIKAHGLTRRMISIHGKALEKIIANYTREAGVRNLEREIANACRKVARGVAEGKNEKVTVMPKIWRTCWDPRNSISSLQKRHSPIPGLVTGLAWTPSGGDILFIEATRMPGDGKLILTGSLGDVMKESAQGALSYIRANADTLKLDLESHKENDFHIHVPAGAIPKDGPSAGLQLPRRYFAPIENNRYHRTWR